MAKADYYEVLGINKDASDSEIKSAFRKAAKQYHPDLHPGDKEAEAKFKEINEAYEVLSDSTKRAQYDQFGHAALAIFRIFSVPYLGDSAVLAAAVRTETALLRATI